MLKNDLSESISSESTSGSDRQSDARYHVQRRRKGTKVFRRTSCNSLAMSKGPYRHRPVKRSYKEYGSYKALRHLENEAYLENFDNQLKKTIKGVLNNSMLTDQLERSTIRRKSKLQDKKLSKRRRSILKKNYARKLSESSAKSIPKMKYESSFGTSVKDGIGNDYISDVPYTTYNSGVTDSLSDSSSANPLRDYNSQDDLSVMVRSIKKSIKPLKPFKVPADCKRARNLPEAVDNLCESLKGYSRPLKVKKFGPRKSDKVLQDLKQKDREQRKTLVLWRKPFQTLQYFLFECKHQLWQGFNKLLSSKWILILLCFATALYFVSISFRGSHTTLMQAWIDSLKWYAIWPILGIMSSVGLGTGLHTFVLYLGPHIAKVTLAAYECMSVDFPSPPYPDQIICPTSKLTAMNIWIILKKVRVESFLWGAGTAIGELPPYYLARSAMLTGVDPDDEEYEEAAQKIESMANSNDTTLYTRAMKIMKDLVEKVGFFGIMLAASIPNPLFDLAGITCGHFLVPFWTFFGATLIGKAVIKTHIQMLFVIVLFSEDYVSILIDWIGYLPLLGPSLQKPFTEFLTKQKANLHHEPGTLEIEGSENILKRGFDLLVSGMIIFFLLSIVNSMAQNCLAREQKSIREKKMDRRR